MGTVIELVESDRRVPAEAERIRIRSVQPDDVLALVGAAVSSFALVWLLYTRILPLQGTLGFVVLWYVTFLTTVWLIARSIHETVRARDQVVKVIVWSGGACVFVPLVLILGYVAAKGYHALRPQFFTETQQFVGPDAPPTEGGGIHAIVGTLEQVGIATVLAVPLGVLSAVYLNEVRGRFARPLRLLVDAMSAVPSIVAGLFIYATWRLGAGNEASGFAGALALAVLFIPTVTRTSEVVLRLVPNGLREASLALGGTDYRTVGQVVLPTARAGLTTAVILGIARVIGETAPLIWTIGGAFTMNANPFRGPQDALPYFVYRLILLPDAAQVQRAWTGALVLVLLVLVLFLIARAIGGRAPGHVGRLKRWRLSRKETP